MYNGSYQSYGQGSFPQPPANNYGSHMQPAPLYQAPPPANVQYYQQQQPDPAIQIATDPNAFAQMFKAQLASLTFNSKPIITNVTILSHEHMQRMSQVVARCLEEHVLSCPPSYRLPALYTIDSICKNVGHPYTALWSDRILRMFMETYRVVDHSVKVRMEELLATWRNSGANGRPLFGDEAQYNIERALFGNAGPPVAAAPPALQHHASVSAPVYGGNVALAPFDQQQQQQIRAKTIERFDHLLAIGSHDQHHNPQWFDIDRMQALAKLRLLVTDTPLSAEEIKQIQSQLDLLEAEVESRRQPVAHPSPLQQVQSTNSPRLNSGGPATLPPSIAGALANLGRLGVGSSTPPVSHRQTPAAAANPAASAVSNPASAENLIASLRMAGLLPSTQLAPPVKAVDEQDLEYSNMIMSLSLKLTTADMQRDIPLGSLQAINFKELPLQCRQCANRYPSSAQGQASMDQHLDWHFRQNRRAKDSAVRGQSRSWFSRLEDWIRGGYDDDSPSSSSDRNDPGVLGGSGGRTAVAMTPAQELELKAATNAFVVAPSDDPGVVTKPCPICKELFKSEWSEDEEEWIWKNAVKVGEVYYHGSCHYSAKTISTSVKQQSSDSREGTPLADALLSPKPAAGTRIQQIKSEEKSQPKAPAAGVKRKAEDEGEGGSDAESAPPKMLKPSTATVKEEP